MTRQLPILLTLASLLCASSALAADRPLVGVLDLNGADAKLSRAEVLDLTGLVRQKALDLLGDRYDIITRENLEDLLKASGKTLEKCMDGACETEIGRKIGAELIVSGSVRKTFGKLSLELKLHSTDPPKVLGIKNARVKRKNELPEAMTKLATTLLGVKRQSNGVVNQRNVTSPRVPATTVAAGSSHTCALDQAGQAVCWGDDDEGQSSPPKGIFTTISGSGHGTCALRKDGTAVCWGWGETGLTSPPHNSFTTISVGGFHACGLEPQGQAVCWGDNDEGQSSPPKGSFTTISAGFDHTCALDHQGRAVCWGDNEKGQSSPRKVPFKAITAGEKNTCAIDIEGRAICWGDDQLGQSHPPTGNFKEISAGSVFTCALDLKGRAVCWGRNWSGESSPPKGRFLEISAGLYHACAVNSQRHIVCWGFGGQKIKPPSIFRPR